MRTTEQVYAVIRLAGESSASLYFFGSWREYAEAVFTPEIDFLRTFSAVRLTKDKSTARKQLINIQEAQAEPGLSYAELAKLQEIAHKIARRAGLVREARENGII